LDEVLLDFLREHRDDIIARTKARVAKRPVPRADPTEMEKGIPLFLTQLTEIFRLETIGVQGEPDAVEASAAIHGAEMLRHGLTVAQVIHDYGDICQVVTQLAGELKLQIGAEEYSTFNRCLDDAMAAAVSEYLQRRERVISDKEIERLGALAHEQRNLLGAAMLAFQALRAGSVGVNGSTGAVLGRSLIGLRTLTERSLAEVRVAVGAHHPTRIDLAEFIEEIEASATMEAQARKIQLTVLPVMETAGIEGDRQMLASAVGNLLTNAFKFSRAGGHVTVRTKVAAGRVSIEVEDECGGFPPGRAAEMLRPFEQRGKDRTGLGLGLTISRQSVAANGGSIQILNLPGKGCVFTIDLPVGTSLPS
jgi:signal transduction histidine kinase